MNRNSTVMIRIDNTRAALEAFQKSRKAVDQRDDMHPIQKKAVLDAYDSQIEKLANELQELEQSLKL